jgi:3-phosphoshikimate 1-carboxyvinyltransferase
VTSRTIAPGRLVGRVFAPASKSYTHRALVAGHLTGRRYVVRGPLDAADTRATARALKSLGSRVRFERHRWTVEPAPARSHPGPIDCGESGTTLRFAAALAALSPRRVELRGAGRLAERPMDELLQVLTALGGRFRRTDAPHGLPLVVQGPIRPGNVLLDASRSSQFASALIFALPTLPGPSEIRLKGPIVSEPYIDASLAVLRLHRVRAVRRGRRFTTPGRQRFHGRGMSVPGDASSAAYFWAAAAITGGRIRVTGVPRKWPQADLKVLELLRAAGARVRPSASGATVAAGAPRPFRIDLTSAPDLYPLAAVIAATIPGASRLEGAPHVVLKESDRRAGAERLVHAMGGSSQRVDGGLSIWGTEHPRSFRLEGITDHRVVMSAAVGALVGSGASTVGEANAVAKSFPRFWDVLESVRAEGTP